MEFLKEVAGALAYKLDRSNAEDFISLLPDELKNNEKVKSIVLMYGQSDDLCEFRGAFNDEAGAGEIYFSGKEFIKPCEDNCKYYQNALRHAPKVGLIWLPDVKPDRPIPSLCWRIKTDIEHEKIYIYEDGEPFSEAILFYDSEIE